jgi:cytochrome c-type biogenesis protein
MLFVYSLGIGLPFLLTALGVGSFLKLFQRYKRFIRWGEIAAGGLLIAAGFLMFTDHFTALADLFSFFNRFVL